MPAMHLQMHFLLSIHPTLTAVQLFHTLLGMEMSVGFQLQADPFMGIFKEEDEQNKENIPPLNAVSSGSPCSCFHALKRRPLQDITHLTVISTDMDTIHNGRRVSVMRTRPLVDSTIHGRKKKRKISSMSNDGNSNLVNPKKPLLRKSFR